MHDNTFVAFEIHLPFIKDHGTPFPILTIWHIDPEKDGTDDSCGSFIRARHLDSKMLDEVRKDFSFHYKSWFHKDSDILPAKMNTVSLLSHMYRSAAWIYFNRNQRKLDRFLRNNLHEIILMAGNPYDSFHDTIENEYDLPPEEFKRSILTLSSSITCHIARLSRPWYKNPKWHIHHWRLQFHFKDCLRIIFKKLKTIKL